LIEVNRVSIECCHSIALVVVQCAMCTVVTVETYFFYLLFAHGDVFSMPFFADGSDSSSSSS